LKITWRGDEGVKENNPMSHGGQKMREARRKAGIWSQKELADRTGIAANIISDLERGQRSMSPTWARRIAQEIGVPAADIME